MRQMSVLRRVSLAILALACAGIASGQSNWLDLENAPRLPAGPPVNFGTTQESFVTVGAWDFDPLNSSQTYTYPAALSASRYSTGGGTGFIAGPQLPDGAVLTSFTFDLCDSSAVAAHWTAAVVSCNSLDGVCAILGASVMSVSDVGTPCAAYTQDVSGLNYVVNNQDQRLALVAIPGANNTTNLLAGGLLGYKLQVSPAPLAATFGDVPTDHMFFQFIEALAKSGITGGCGGGNYCPDNPVTRGQMAVFLAKGFGLQFP
jgi:S-layer homology domain